MNVDVFFKQFVPLFIVAGVIILLGTFLGPLGLLVVPAGIAILVYLVYRVITNQPFN